MFEDGDGDSTTCMSAADTVSAPMAKPGTARNILIESQYAPLRSSDDECNYNAASLMFIVSSRPSKQNN